MCVNGIMPDMKPNFFESALQCLLASDVAEKIAQVDRLQADWKQGGMDFSPLRQAADVVEAGRPERPERVSPRNLPRRRLGSPQGHAAMIHAIAHIEFNAINLACDALYRFPGMPEAYYADWLQVAVEECRHFELLQQRLYKLDHEYGDFPAHNGLWELAQQTRHDLLVRMALVPRVMEARGLDVTPDIISKFASIGDDETVAILHIILAEEIGHVEAGTRWYRYLCAQRNLDPEKTYFRLLQEYLKGKVHCPLHRQARLEAGFSETELARLEALCSAS